MICNQGCSGCGRNDVDQYWFQHERMCAECLRAAHADELDHVDDAIYNLDAQEARQNERDQQEAAAYWAARMNYQYGSE